MAHFSPWSCLPLLQPPCPSCRSPAPFYCVAPVASLIKSKFLSWILQEPLNTPVSFVTVPKYPFCSSQAHLFTVPLLLPLHGPFLPLVCSFLHLCPLCSCLQNTTSKLGLVYGDLSWGNGSTLILRPLWASTGSCGALLENCTSTWYFTRKFWESPGCGVRERKEACVRRQYMLSFEDAYTRSAFGVGNWLIKSDTF